MNSKVKQAQKEGARLLIFLLVLLTPLSIMLFIKLLRFPIQTSLVKISLYRVVPSIMMRFFEALKSIAGCEAIRPDIAGIMGAFGAALMQESVIRRKETTMLSIDKINELKIHHFHGKLSWMYQQLPSDHQ